MESITEMVHEVATQKTPQQAAALIQARVRGVQHREKQRRLINAVTKLQARQRARYTRREFQKLLEFYNEQESFLMESKRRQTRLWHRQLELYFLQHTTAEEMERIRQFQYERGARRIQREWRRSHPKPLEEVDVSGLGKPFDPFGLVGTPVDSMRDHPAATRELYGELPRQARSLSVDADAVARRRAEIQGRLQRVRKEMEKSRDKEEKTTRRELYTTLVEMRQQTANRLKDIEEKYRRLRPQKDLEAAQVMASVDNRSKYLLSDVRANLLKARCLPTQQVLKERDAFEKETVTWSEQRKKEAWNHHTKIIDSVLGRDKWYHTSIAGETRDIRRVYSNSPWEHEKQVWQWPVSTSTAVDIPKMQNRVATALDRFKFVLPSDEEEPDNQAEEEMGEVCVPEPLKDAEASSWWRAHATQSHFSYKKMQQKRKRQLFSRVVENNRSNQSEDAHVTPEMLVNPVFFNLYQEIKATARHQEVQHDVKARLAQIEKRIHQKVVEIETKIDVNTRLILEKKAYEQQQKQRITQEQRAATQIQRHVRGKLGRNKAKEHMAQYFVMVRGRAIRKGRCEECGEQQAVLECKECEESLHFCPVCWVQVHSTRRRKAHVPIPMVMHPHESSAPQARSQTESKASAKSIWRGDNEPQKAMRTQRVPISTSAALFTRVSSLGDGANPAVQAENPPADIAGSVPPATLNEPAPYQEGTQPQLLAVNLSTTLETAVDKKEDEVQVTEQVREPTGDQTRSAGVVQATDTVVTEAPSHVHDMHQKAPKPASMLAVEKETTAPKLTRGANGSGRVSLRDRMASGKKAMETSKVAVPTRKTPTSETVAPTTSEQHQLQNNDPSLVQAKQEEVRQSQNVEITDVVEQNGTRKERRVEEAITASANEHE